MGVQLGVEAEVMFRIYDAKGDLAEQRRRRQEEYWRLKEKQ